MPEIGLSGLLRKPACKNNFARGRLKAFSDDLLHISLEGMMMFKRICLSVPIAVSLSGRLKRLSGDLLQNYSYMPAFLANQTILFPA